MSLRQITLEDYGKLIQFWKSNYFISEMDSKSRFKLFLKMNPNLSVLAEENGKIVGTALGSFDGRRGYLQKVVVDKAYYRKGIGTQLVKQVIKKLKALGATYIPIAVKKDLVFFYGQCGFKKNGQTAMNIEI